MNTERQPLLMDAEVQGRSARPRPDTRESPESTLVDVKSEGGKNFSHTTSSSFAIFIGLRTNCFHSTQ